MKFKVNTKVIALLHAFLVMNYGNICSAKQPSFQSLDIPGYNIAHGISPDGTIVLGYSHTNSGSGNLFAQAFYWSTEDGRIDLGDLPGGDFRSFSYASSLDNSIIVGEGKCEEGWEAFRWTEDTGMIGLGELPGGSYFSAAFDISGDGSIVVGQSCSDRGWEPFRWTAEEGMIGLGYLPGGSYEYGTRAYAISLDGTVIVGGSTSANAPIYEAFRWTSETGMVGLGDLLGGEFLSEATDVSADGSVIVGYSMSGNCINSDHEAFIWTACEGMIGLGDLPGGQFQSEARAVSGDGSIVVGSSTSAEYGEAFIWDKTNGIRGLKSVLIDDYKLDLSDWKLYTATGISVDGLTITGWGERPNGTIGSWIATIPEPCTLCLLGCSAAMFLRRRRT